MNNFNFKDVSKNGYVPRNLGIGGGDYYEITVCLDCGQMQGDWPVTDTEFEVE